MKTRSAALIALALGTLSCPEGVASGDTVMTAFRAQAEAARLCEVNAGHSAITAYRDILCFSGSIETDTYFRIREAAAGRTFRFLVVASRGGVVDTALDIAEWLEEKSIALVVRDFCFSSCANYLFVAAVEKVVMPGAVVAWHDLPGSSQNYSREHQLDPLQARLKRVAERSERFFELRGVDPDLAGELPKAPDPSTTFAQQWYATEASDGVRRLGWTYSADILASRFNVKGIKHYRMPSQDSEDIARIRVTYGVSILISD